MKLKRLVIFFIALSTLLISLLFYAVKEINLSRLQRHQIGSFAAKTASRIENMLAAETRRIESLCAEYAADRFVSACLTEAGEGKPAGAFCRTFLSEAHLDLLAILNQNREIVLQSSAIPGGDVAFETRIRNPLWENVLRTFASERSEGFLCATKHLPLIAVLAPVRPQVAGETPKLRLLLGKFIDRPFEERLADALQEDGIRFLPALNAEYSSPSIESRKPEVSRLYVQRDGPSMHIFHPVRDRLGRDIFFLKTTTDARIFQTPEKVANHSLLFFVLSTILMGVILYRFINGKIMRRLESISQRTNQIATLKDLTTRIETHDERSDEISTLSSNINRMLERLEKESLRQKEMEKLLVQNEKLIATGRLAANIAHEINNPLFAISNSIQVLKKKVPDRQLEIQEVLRLAEKEISRVRKITKNLADSSKSTDRDFKQADLGRIIDAAIRNLKRSGKAKRVSFDFASTEANLPLLCDPAGLQEAFFNLLLNSVEAMKGEGVITLAVAQKNHSYEIHLRDNGPGFDAEIRQRLFEPFNSSKNQKGGGLGLYTSYHIIERHEGHLQLAEQSGQGAHFIIEIPRG